MRTLQAVAIGTLFSFCGCTKALTTQHGTLDTAWMRDYAIPYTTSEHSSNSAKVQQQLNLAPHFLAILRYAFPQKQWFWKDHGKFQSVADLAQIFLGVPGRSWNAGGSAWLDESRYVTEEGCVPHDCFDRGMLWVDTGSKSAAIIFTLTQPVASGLGNTRVWVFTSSKTLGNNPPAAYQHSVRRWYDTNVSQGYAENVLLVTIVTPDGEQRDVDFCDIAGKLVVTGTSK